MSLDNLTLDQLFKYMSTHAGKNAFRVLFRLGSRLVQMPMLPCVGRDKAYRLVQYWAKWYQYHLAQQGAPKETVKTYKDLSSNLSQVYTRFLCLVHL